MTPTPIATRWNLDAIESAYRRWREDPAQVDESWRFFFDGFELAGTVNGSIVRLIDAYRELGHLQAHIDPLSEPPGPLSQLERTEFGLQESDLDRTFDTSHFHGLAQGTLRQLEQALRETYCHTIGAQTMHIQDRRARDWLQERMETGRNRPRFSRSARLHILQSLQSTELFEKFLHTSYVGQKRFSLEGGETLIPVLDALTARAADHGVREIVMGMSHRGRLDVLANILGKPYREIFSEFEDNYIPLSSGGDGDVKYHLGFSCDRVDDQGRHIHLSLSPNPSHLEAVNPVVEGRTRAKQQRFGDTQRVLGLPILIHGDAAFAAQGVVAETLNLSQLAGFTTGGTLHIVVNNQIGFTTAPADARSTVYCTDVAKMIEAPIFHVNAEDAEAAVYVSELALDFRQTFHRDVVIDLVGYRRYGHNESDDPSYTQPIMVARIKERSSMGQVYAAKLMADGVLTAEQSKALDDRVQARLQEAKDELRSKDEGGRIKDAKDRSAAPSDSSLIPHPSSLPVGWEGLDPDYAHEPIETGVTGETIRQIVTALTHLPEGFHVHPRIARALAMRADDVKAAKPIDWALAEALAFGSLLLEGTSVRLSGQDCRRGTFSQRHAVLVDRENATEYCPLAALANLAPGQTSFSAIDSPLSEYAVLGFELGYSFDAPGTLVLWEAQFGDFSNGAQVIIDQFLVCCRTKWQRDSGLVLLLPHGYEGQGPEHSSARLERFLQLCAEDNIQVCSPSTPAQYFHLLRRQMRRGFRKPLIVMTPKSLLRHKQARSPLEEFRAGHFREILDDGDPLTPPSPRGRGQGEGTDAIRRVLLCSGKICYDLLARRTTDSAAVAIVRIEQFYPLEEKLLTQTLRRYRKAQEFIWVQEEPRNMGGWSFMEPRLRALGFEARYIGRDASASPAVGSHEVHVEEQQAIIDAAMAGTLIPDSRMTPSEPGSVSPGSHGRRRPREADKGKAS